MHTPLKLAWGLVVLMLVVAISLYPSLPARMPSHWNAAGDVDGTLGTFWGTFLLPIIAVGLLALLQYVPKLDPLRRNAEGFRLPYERFLLALTFFLVYLFALTLSIARGAVVNMTIALIPAFAGLLFVLAYLLGSVRRNWFIGIRTPWTLSSDRVWDRTHRLGARLFAISGCMSLTALLFPKVTIILLIGPILLSAVIAVIASYIYHRSE